MSARKLGAIELLWHGIFPFKINAAGARTDLVYQEAISDLASKQRYADGFVLTEWKIAKTKQLAARRFTQAHAQARLYAGGVLAGAELTSYRFAVVVTLEEVPAPADVVEDGVTYRHINLAVEPRSPSRARAR